MIITGHFLSWQVSTHSRPEAAGGAEQQEGAEQQVSTHSRPEAAGHQV